MVIIYGSKKKLKLGFTDEDILQEINILTKLEHPHIIKIYETYNYNPKRTRATMCFTNKQHTIYNIKT